MVNRERVGETTSSAICGRATMNNVHPSSTGDHPVLPASWVSRTAGVRRGVRPRQTRRRLRGRQPLCGTGVTSWMPATSSPAAARERIAVSRPEPGPFTNTSTFCRPCSCAARAAFSAASCAANGADLREPLKPTLPALAHHRVLPCRSVMVTIVLLNVDLMCACPCRTFFFSRRLVFLALGFAMIFLFPPGPSARCRLLLRLDLLLARDRLLRALAGARVGVRALSVDRERPAVADALVAPDLDLALDVLRDLAPEVTFDLEIRVDVGADLHDLFFGQVANLRAAVDVDAVDDLERLRGADPEDVAQGDVEPLVTRKVDAGDTSHVGALPFSLAAACGAGSCRSP